MSFVTVVSGLPRSGTSVMMQMLAAGGLAPLTDQIRQPDEDNPRGYYELEAVKRTRHDPAWLAEAPGKVVKLVHLLLLDLPANNDYRVVMMRRPIDEVLRSQRAMLERQGRALPDIAPERLAQVFEAQMTQVLRTIAARPNFRAMEIEYHRCLRDPAGTAAALAAFLELPLDVIAMADAVEPSLHRQRSPRAFSA